jgi:hypothetical protein
MIKNVFACLMLLCCVGMAASVVITEPKASSSYASKNVLSYATITINDASNSSAVVVCNESLNGVTVKLYNMVGNSSTIAQDELSLVSGVNTYTINCAGSITESKFFYKPILDWFFIGAGLAVVVLLIYIFK